MRQTRDGSGARRGSEVGCGTARPLGAVLWIASMLIAGAVGLAPSHAVAHPEHRAVDKIFERWNRSDSPGCAVAVIKNGRVDYRRGYGMANLDHGIRITPSTVFHAASLSKQVTALAIMLLVKDGKLSLDDPVRQYVPELPDFGTPITIAQALGHTGGLRDQWVLANLAGWRLSDDTITEDDVLWLVSRMRSLNFTPGNEMVYSNTGYTLAARIIRERSRLSLAEFARRHIFMPLGMTRTVFRERHGLIVRHQAYGYRTAPVLELRMPNYDLVGPTNLLTTVDDLARWERNFEHMFVGGAEVIRRMQMPGRLNDGTRTKYGLGLRLTKHRTLDVVEHEGQDAGYRAHLIRFPTERLSVVCLCNLTLRREDLPQFLVREVADIYLAKAGTPTMSSPNTAGAIPDRADLTRRAGIYRSSESEEGATVRSEAGTLVLSFRLGHGALLPLGGDRFRWNGPFPLEDVELKRARDGRPGQLVVRPEGQAPIVLDAVPVLPVAASQLVQYEGRYYSEELDAVYHIRLEGSSLAVIRKKFPAAPLVGTRPDEFTAETLGLLSASTLRFRRGPQQTVDGFHLTTERVRNVWFVRAPGP